MNCFCSSPLLSETLRQFSTTDNSTKNVPEGIAINLDVTISDPTKDFPSGSDLGLVGLESRSYSKGISYKRFIVVGSTFPRCFLGR